MRRWIENIYVVESNTTIRVVLECCTIETGYEDKLRLPLNQRGRCNPRGFRNVVTGWRDRELDAPASERIVVADIVDDDFTAGIRVAKVHGVVIERQILLDDYLAIRVDLQLWTSSTEHTHLGWKDDFASEIERTVFFVRSTFQ